MTSPFLEAFLAATPRQLGAPTLALEIRETIQRWFDSHANGAQDQARILGALGALMTDQILQNPEPAVQSEVADRVLSSVLRAVKREQARRNLFGLQAKLVLKQ